MYVYKVKFVSGSERRRMIFCANGGGVVYNEASGLWGDVCSQVAVRGGVYGIGLLSLYRV